jgi:hypothetical protein
LCTGETHADPVGVFTHGTLETTIRCGEPPQVSASTGGHTPADEAGATSANRGSYACGSTGGHTPADEAGATSANRGSYACGSTGGHAPADEAGATSANSRPGRLAWQEGTPATQR